MLDICTNVALGLGVLTALGILSVLFYLSRVDRHQERDSIYPPVDGDWEDYVGRDSGLKVQAFQVSSGFDYWNGRFMTHARPRDYIVRGSSGAQFVIAPDVFRRFFRREEYFEAVEEI